MAVTTTNLTMGPGDLWRGAFGAAEPATVATAPAAAWTDMGGTQGGVTLNANIEFAELEVDQIPETPERRVTKREVTLGTNLAETTLDNLAAALNEAAPTVASGVSTLELDNSQAAFRPGYSALLFRGPATGVQRREVVGRKMLSTEGTEFAYQKDGQNVYSVTWTSHYVSPSIKSIRLRDGAAA